jgi:hypothetical protein
MTPSYDCGYHAAERDIQRGINRQPSAFRGAEFIAGYQDAQLDARMRLTRERAASQATGRKQAQAGA